MLLQLIAQNVYNLNTSEVDRSRYLNLQWYTYSVPVRSAGLAFASVGIMATATTTTARLSHARMLIPDRGLI